MYHVAWTFAVVAKETEGVNSPKKMRIDSSLGKKVFGFQIRDQSKQRRHVPSFGVASCVTSVLSQFFFNHQTGEHVKEVMLSRMRKLVVGACSK